MSAWRANLGHVRRVRQGLIRAERRQPERDQRIAHRVERTCDHDRPPGRDRSRASASAPRKSGTTSAATPGAAPQRFVGIPATVLGRRRRNGQDERGPPTRQRRQHGAPVLVAQDPHHDARPAGAAPSASERVDQRRHARRVVRHIEDPRLASLMRCHCSRPGQRTPATPLDAPPPVRARSSGASCSSARTASAAFRAWCCARSAA